MTLPGLVRANNLNDVVDRERAWDNLGSSLATGDIAIPAPSLDLNFAANKSLVDDISGNNLITFSRASTATFIGSNGLLQTAASGVPRFDHNPATGESLGLLVEEARINSQTYSNSFSTNWTLNQNGTTTVTPNAAIGPSGQLDATKLSNTAGAYILGPNFTDDNVGFGMSATYNLSTKTITTQGSVVSTSLTELGNGWFRCAFMPNTSTKYAQTVFVKAAESSILTIEHYVNAIRLSVTGGIGVGVYIWGAQVEAGTFPTSYIPTTTATVTRAADIASITGANFSSWWNPNSSTYYASFFSQAKAKDNNAILGINGNASERQLQFAVNGGSVNSVQITTRVDAVFYTSLVSTTSLGVPIKAAGIINDTEIKISVNGTLGNSASPPRIASSAPTTMDIGRFLAESQYSLNGTIARLTYWPTRLYDQALQYITQPSITAINLYAFNYAINGKDVLALNAVRNTSTRNFIFIKGLLSAAQPRLTTAAASTSSALTLATNALPKLSPTSSGNYFFASGITLSGVTTRINGTNALSIATSPFSGSTATAPLLFSELRPQANWRFTEPMPSGTIASPEFAIPFETNDFVLFMKAGPN